MGHLVFPLSHQLALLFTLAALVAKGDTKPVDNTANGFASLFANFAPAALAGAATSSSQNDADSDTDQTTTALKTLLASLLGTAKSSIIDGIERNYDFGNDQNEAVFKSIAGAVLGSAQTSLTGERTAARDVDLTANIPITAVMKDPKGVFKTVTENFKREIAARGGDGGLEILDSFLEALYYCFIFATNLLSG